MEAGVDSCLPDCACEQFDSSYDSYVDVNKGPTALVGGCGSWCADVLDLRELNERQLLANNRAAIELVLATGIQESAAPSDMIDTAVDLLAPCEYAARGPSGGAGCGHPTASARLQAAQHASLLELIEGGTSPASLHSKVEEWLADYCGEDIPIADQKMAMENNLFENSDCDQSMPNALSSSDLLRCLEMAAQCGRRDCTEQCCQLGQNILQAIDTCMKLKQLTRWQHCLPVMKCLVEHGSGCYDQLHCRVPWCDFFFQAAEFGFDPIDSLCKWNQTYFSESPSVFFTDVPGDERFIGLKREFKHIPKVGVDYSMLMRLGRFGSVVLATTHGAHPQYWAIKRMKQDAAREKMLLRFKDTTHGHIVEQLWLAAQQGFMYLTSAFAGECLRTLLLSQYPHGLDASTIRRYASQLLSAAAFLHERQILFLGWTASNMTVEADRMAVKLCDFSHAILVTSDLEDDLLYCDLPPLTVPPELLSLSGVDFPLTEMWGFGCLVHEMATSDSHGRQFLYRHTPAKDIYDVLKKRYKSPLMNDLEFISDLHIKTLITKCLKINPKKRCSVTSLMDFCALENCYEY